MVARVAPMPDGLIEVVASPLARWATSYRLRGFAVRVELSPITYLLPI